MNEIRETVKNIKKNYGYVGKEEFVYELTKTNCIKKIVSEATIRLITEELSNKGTFGVVDKEFEDYLYNQFDELNIFDVLEKVQEDEGVLRNILCRNGLSVSKITVLRNDYFQKKKFMETVSYDMTQVVTSDCNILLREEEIEICLINLCKKQKNNLLLLGEAGVGKTAIVEAIAKKISMNQVPNALKGKKIYLLQLSHLLSNTKYRGEFEEKISRFLKYVMEDGDIVFVDEIHTIVKAGEAEGGVSMGNILKPYLARAGIQFIGATTIDEYNKYICSDKALERRFQTLIIEPLTSEQTKEIADVLLSTYEEYHHVTYCKEDVYKIIDVLEREIGWRQFPDKIIDLLDFVGAYYQSRDKIIDYSMMRDSMKKVFKAVH